jgi:hypothetical protein
MDKDRQMTVKVANLAVLTLECDLRTNVSNPLGKNRQLDLRHPLSLPKSLQKITPPRSNKSAKATHPVSSPLLLTGGGSGVLSLPLLNGGPLLLGNALPEQRGMRWSRHAAPQGRCHLQLNRGAAHLETDFAIKSGAKFPFCSQVAEQMHQGFLPGFSERSNVVAAFEHRSL